MKASVKNNAMYTPEWKADLTASVNNALRSRIESYAIKNSSLLRVQNSQTFNIKNPNFFKDFFKDQDSLDKCTLVMAEELNSILDKYDASSRTYKDLKIFIESFCSSFIESFYIVKPKNIFEIINLPKYIQNYKSNEQVIMIDSFENNQAHAWHVKGIISKIAPKVKIIPKAFSSGAVDSMIVWKNSVKDILGTKNGAKLINISAEPGNTEDLIKLCKNHIVVLAAPNNGQSFDNVVESALKNVQVQKHMLVVINIMPDGITLFNNTAIPSNNNVFQEAGITAPGTWIESTVPKNEDNQLGLMEMSGTSMATPFVTGLAALLLANFPKLALEDIVQIIKDSADKSDHLGNKEFFGNGLINVETALQLAEANSNLVEIGGDESGFFYN